MPQLLSMSAPGPVRHGDKLCLILDNTAAPERDLQQQRESEREVQQVQSAKHKRSSSSSPSLPSPTAALPSKLLTGDQGLLD